MIFLSVNFISSGYQPHPFCCYLFDITERFKELVVDKSDLVIEKKLGEGQFGTVYRGKLKTLSQIQYEDPLCVAVKYLKDTADRQDRKVFLDEAWRMRHLNHENVVRLLGVGLHEATTFIVLEYMNGSLLYGILLISFATMVTCRAHMFYLLEYVDEGICYSENTSGIFSCFDKFFYKTNTRFSSLGWIEDKKD